MGGQREGGLVHWQQRKEKNLYSNEVPLTLRDGGPLSSALMNYYLERGGMRNMMRLG